MKAEAKPAVFVPGSPDIWAFVLFEALVFTAYFGVYMFRRMQEPVAFLSSQAQLDVRVGVLNTLVLLVSSWSIARCVQASRAGDYRVALRGAVVTAAFGLAFMVSKVAEWATKARDGIGFTTDEFFSFYYFLTGIHFVHLLIGFVFLGVVMYQIIGPERRDQKTIETGATYWHTVDFLWIAIFSLVYLVR